MLKAFKDVEANFDERELGLFCLKLGLKLDQEGEDPEKASSLKRFNDSLGYLNRANRMLIKLEEEDSCSVDDIRPILHVVQLEFANSKTAMGRREDAHGNLRNCLEIKELTFEKKVGKLEKFPVSKRCLDIACGILDKKEDAFSVEVAEAYMEISMQYETMNEFETAITLLKRSQSEKLPQEQHSVGSVSARIGWLLLLTGKVQQAIPYLESAAERLKECFGSKHYGVGYIYNNLGAAYLGLDRPQSAAQMVYPLAIKFQEQVIDAWEGHGLSAQDELKEAQRLREQLKKKVRGASSTEPPIRALPLPHKSQVSTRSSQAAVPIDEKLSNAT
ncbi:tetratricopeptide repeat (TPR)-like superfamily protein [Actinidia rufa]|uniref:Tetratricopeptide repeat (TPR)-like superfamily protein n=1 Tax=Actinidia rufa TaxID=165716 RepID=A0A7J0GSF7_9ERIC|nr:tetratricopeptide repeat (TPR)-like superfamily protein [Actinidia rufa]